MKTESSGFAVFLKAAKGAKTRYHAPYGMQSLLAEARQRAFLTDGRRGVIKRV